MVERVIRDIPKVVIFGWPLFFALVPNVNNFLLQCIQKYIIVYKPCISIIHSKEVEW